MTKKLKAAILGFGGIGHCHAAQYPTLKNAELVAVCDMDPKQLKKTDIAINLGNMGKTNLRILHCYSCYGDLIKGEPDLDFIDICLPTDLHCEYACRAMKDGFHVLCEKPMALTARDADKMIRVAKSTDRKLMIAQVVRFDENFGEIRKAYESGKYGKLLRLVMHRNGSLPGTWFRDVKRSGGALMDLHLHDVDFIQSVLGTPDAIIGFGSVGTSGGIDDALMNYVYDNGITANSESSWARSGFHACASAIFEKGTIEATHGEAKLYQNDKPEKILKKDAPSGYGLEIDYFASCIKKNAVPERCTPESTRETIRLIELELKSIKGNGKRICPNTISKSDIDK